MIESSKVNEKKNAMSIFLVSNEVEMEKKTCQVILDPLWSAADYVSVNWVCLFWWVWRWYLAIAIDLMIPKQNWKKSHTHKINLNRESRTCQFDVFDSLSWDKMHKSFQVVIIIICIVIVSTCGFLILILSFLGMFLSWFWWLVFLLLLLSFSRFGQWFSINETSSNWIYC